MRTSILLASLLLVLLSACSPVEQLTSDDQKYLFLASEIEQFHIENYMHKTTPRQVPYILLKTYTSLSGFRGLYGTILVGPDGGEVKYLCIVNILPTIELAHYFFGEMTPEPMPTVFGREETTDPRSYQADESYLYRDSRYLHLILRASRVVYTLLIDGAGVDEKQVRSGLSQKLSYLRHHMDEIR